MEMLLVPAPKLRPFLCLDGTTGGPDLVVDTLITTRMPGRIYLSSRDVRNAARLYGFLEPEHAQALRDELLAAAGLVAARDARIAALEGELAELQDVRSAISRAAERWGADDEVEAA